MLTDLFEALSCSSFLPTASPALPCLAGQCNEQTNSSAAITQPYSDEEGEKKGRHIPPTVKALKWQ